MTVEITEGQLAAVAEMLDDRHRPLPADQPARMRRRIDCVMTVTGRDRGWARARCAATWPAEWAAYLRAVAPA